MEPRIDLAADLNDEDDEGFGWSTLSEARDAGRIRPGVMLVAGNRQAQAVVRVVAVDDDGQVHFTVLPGSVDKNRHLIPGRHEVLAQPRQRLPLALTFLPADVGLPTSFFDHLGRYTAPSFRSHIHNFVVIPLRSEAASPSVLLGG